MEYQIKWNRGFRPSAMTPKVLTDRSITILRRVKSHPLVNSGDESRQANSEAVRGKLTAFLLPDATPA
jgi:hypothetical protein